MQSTAFVVEREISAVGAARRAAAIVARDAGLDSDCAGRLALIVTELGTNLVKHAERGVLLLRALSAPEGGGVEVLSLDRGPGMENLAACLQDGYSTGGSLGTGLGAVLRAAGVFDIFSEPGAGTAIVARVRPKGAAAPVVCLGAVCVAQPGESECGDAWAIVDSGGELALLVADGLGHGPLAAAASRAALSVFAAHAREDAATIVRRCHHALRATRGAVLGVAILDRAARRIEYSAVGNVAATLLEPDGRRGLTPQNGIVGHQLPDLRPVSEGWIPGATLAVNTDGLSTRWSLDAHSGILSKHPSLAAGVLYRDFARGNDDATIVVVHDGAEPSIA